MATPVISEAPKGLDPTVFHDTRPRDLREGQPWHRYYYLINRLPELIEDLSHDLGVADGGRVLDYGCAELPYRKFFAKEVEYVGADLPGNPDASLELRPDGTVPAPDGHFDAVVSTQVLEHVASPEIYLAECFRLLRPGGRLLLTTHGVFPYHPDPVDYWRWTCAGLQRAAELAGFRVIRFEGIVGIVATGVSLIHDGLLRRVPTRWQPPFSFFFQKMIALADRAEGPIGRRYNSLVFGLVAEKP